MIEPAACLQRDKQEGTLNTHKDTFPGLAENQPRRWKRRKTRIC